MATATLLRVPSQRSRVQGFQWSLTGTDDGAWVDLSALQDRTVHLYAAAWNGTGTIVIEGSNEATPTTANAITLRDPAGNALSFTANGLKSILELPRWIRPRCTVTLGANVATVNINARGDTI